MRSAGRSDSSLASVTSDLVTQTSVLRRTHHKELRCIPCRDSSANTQWFIIDHFEESIAVLWESLPRDLVAEATIVAPLCQLQLHQLFGDHDRLPHTDRFQLSYLVSMLFNELRELQHDLHAFATGSLLPFRQCSLGGRDGLVNILLRCTLHLVCDKEVVFGRIVD